MLTLIINTGRIPQQVGLIASDGSKRKCTVRVMDRRRCHISSEWIVDPNWMALNGKDIKVIPAAVSLSASITGVKNDD